MATSGRVLPVYSQPEKRVHRGFFYLDDETVINSLSAVEAGKIDEVVSKVNSLREGGLTASAGILAVKLEGGKKGSSGLEEEMVRTRTRFSVFEIWYQNLLEQKAIGRFSGWGAGAITDVEPGDTIELKAQLEAAPLISLVRAYFWFAGQAKTPGNLFSVKGEELKELKEAEKAMRTIFGHNTDAETVVLASPLGDRGPVVGMSLKTEWLIGDFGRLGGTYTLVAQVDRLINAGEEYPTLRLVSGSAPTPLEISTMKDAVSHFAESGATFGVELSQNQATIEGPGIWLTPIAIFR